MYVFVDRTLSEEIMVNIASDCTGFFQLSNEIEIEEYCHLLDVPNYLDRFIDKAEEEIGIVLSSKERKEIKESVGMYVKTKEDNLGISSYEDVKSAVENIKRR